MTDVNENTNPSDTGETARQTEITPAPAEGKKSDGQNASGQKGFDFNDWFARINRTADTTADFDKEEIDHNKTLCILSYLSWLVIIPLIFMKNTKIVRYHANQGLVLAIIETAAAVVLSLLTFLFNLIPPFFIGSILFSPVTAAVSLACVLLSIFGLINVANGQAKELFLIGKIRIIK